ncbi:MAG TPA: LUD domain-containing protein [Trebonia sp.]|nr:LUD domain-containing protein [Trebonia sp.]
MTAREDILTAIRDHGPAPREMPHMPDFRRAPDDLAGLFTAALARLDGQVITEPPADPQDWLAAKFPGTSRICSAVPEVTGMVTPDQFPDWTAPADLDVTIVRTPLGVAETGSILLTEAELAVTTAAVLARHLVVLLDPADLVENIHSAYRHPSFTRAAYAVLLSGPSGSADIGGVTVHPAQGVTTMTIILWPRA